MLQRSCCRLLEFQVCWQLIPGTWCSNSKRSVANLVVGSWDDKKPAATISNRRNHVRHVLWRMSNQCLVDQQAQFIDNGLLYSALNVILPGCEVTIKALNNETRLYTNSVNVNKKAKQSSNVYDFHFSFTHAQE